MTEAQIDEMLGVQDDTEEEENTDKFLVYRENWDCVTVFSSLGSRWKPDGMSGRFYGLERADIASTLQLMQIKPDQYRQIFGDLRIMESEALRIFNRGK